MFALDDKLGNTGVVGRYFWRIEKNNVRNALEKCLTWTLFQRKVNFFYWYIRLVRRDWRMACPCSVRQAWWDRRFFWDWRSSWPRMCFRSRRAKYFTYRSRHFVGYVRFRMTQVCCYSTQWPGDWGALKTGPPDGSRVEVRTYYYRWNHVEEIFTDLQAYKYCCVDVPLCPLFYYYRPSDFCLFYRPPIRRKFYFMIISDFFVRSFIRSFVRSFVRSFIHSFIHPSIHFN